MLNARPLLRGIATYLPQLRPRRTEAGGEVSPRYCYTVWMRHLVMAHRSGLRTDPEVVGELGPGDSLGLGVAALLSGATRYHAFDIVEHTNVPRNLRLFDAIVELFRARAPIPDAREFPQVDPRLDGPNAYDFPHAILTEERLARALAPARVAAVRDALEHLGRRAEFGIEMSYVAYRYGAEVARPHSIDMVVSQAVMEHVDDPARMYVMLAAWLKPDGVASHVIDFRSHGTAPTWDGHWTYSDLAWRLVRGRRTFVISNRLSLSAHRRLLEEAGFDVVRCVPTPSTPGIARRDLAHRFAGLPDEDLATASAFLQAVPNGRPARRPATASALPH